MIAIRPFRGTERDYRDAVAVRNAVWPEYPMTVEEMQVRDAIQPARTRWGRYLAEVDGQPVGLGYYFQTPWMYHPRKFRFEVGVLPEFRGRGIGTALYEHMLEALAPTDPIALLTTVREDATDGLDFVQRHGFQEVMRVWEYRLPLEQANLSSFLGLDRKLAQEGIEIRTVQELASDPERDRKLFELECHVDEDIPYPWPVTEMTFEEWQRFCQRPSVLPEGWFVAVHQGRYVGVTALHRSLADPRVLIVYITGVHRDYRRKGVGSALKWKAIEFARQYGARELRTWNEAGNQVIRAINERLGFVRQPAHIDFVKQLRPEEDPQHRDAGIPVVDWPAEMGQPSEALAP